MLQAKKKMTQQTSKTVKKPFKMRYLRVYSRHPSHSVLRNRILLPVFSCIRLGSTTVSNLPYKVEINSVQSIKNSADKLLMKKCFNAAEVKTAKWLQGGGLQRIVETLEFPIIAKNRWGSRGRGNSLIKDEAELKTWLANHNNLDNYIFEEYKNYSNEFRLHVTEDGYFYACRKALKKDTPDNKKFQRHDDNCVWLLENNAEFNKPNSWDDIVKDCVKALKAVGADILSFDIRVQSAKNSDGKARKYQEYILIECNSASSMDNGKDAVSVCAQKYIDEIPKIIKRKLNNQ
jgi:glutathione synthase/RimK-type ligase-like ATP-grasp enzyme